MIQLDKIIKKSNLIKMIKIKRRTKAPNGKVVKLGISRVHLLYNSF